MSIPAATRALVLERDGHRCLRCNRSIEGFPYSVHHRQGRRNNRPSALVTLCGTGTSPHCHQSVHANPADSYLSGWLVRRLGLDDTAQIPLLTGSGLIYLTDDGRKVPA